MVDVAGADLLDHPLTKIRMLRSRGIFIAWKVEKGLLVE
jgi:hypothetical protein